MISRRALLGTAGATMGVVAATSTPAAAAVPAMRPVGRRALRVMSWNIFHGGRGVTESDVGVGPENLRLLLDQMVEADADVHLVIETYGSGPAILSALNRGHRGQQQDTYTSHQITQRGNNEDNLWMFTRLDVDQTLPGPASGGLVSDFNLGGLRVRKQGRAFNVFVCWLQYTDPWIGYLIDESAAAVRAGLDPRHAAEAVMQEDRVQTQQLQEILQTHLPTMLDGNTDPIVIGGDFNTNAASDWTTQWKSASEHFGLAYDLTATKVLTDDGYVDSFRAAHPDVDLEQGRTWSPLPTERMITPSRIDFLFGKGLGVKASTSIDQRLKSHPTGPFYSDHAALVTDFTLR